MISTISLVDFKILRNVNVRLGRYNVVIGPNGSGKTTLLSALRLAAAGRGFSAEDVRSVAIGLETPHVYMGIELEDSELQGTCEWVERPDGFVPFDPARLGSVPWVPARAFLYSAEIYSLDERQIAAAVGLQPNMELRSNGGGLAGVLDRMRDEAPEQFEALNDEVARLLPEFDRILFETPGPGLRSLKLRLRAGHQAIKAADLSQGTLLALALLTIAYLPSPPDIIGIEEPDRGIHPRLYRDIQAALYRLAYPESFGLERKPVQVIVTTHSPFLLDLHRDTPEEIIIAEKTENGAEFHRLTERPELMEILDDVSLGEAWYSGVLGGVPAGS